MIQLFDPGGHVHRGVGPPAELQSACNGAMLTICVGPVCAQAVCDEGIARPRWLDPPGLSATVRRVVSDRPGPGRVG